MNIGVDKDTGWNFDNSYINLPESFYSRQEPDPVQRPNLVILNKPLASFLGLKEKKLQSGAGIDILAGNEIPEGAAFISQAYAGHQFGYFTMLGDGRAVLIGEQITPQKKRFDIQLKGSGRTPYSRGDDGRAALGPMLREYIISEALFNLGIPTTRSLAVVTTGESIIRERRLPGAVLTRVAKSHIRVGTFEFASAYEDIEQLQALADYTLKRHFPNIGNSKDRYLLFLREVIKLQAKLIARWQMVGFIHGVMNTDNMAISGESIDFGPCAFMDVYDPETVFSSIDRRGRYSYENQPKIAKWNLARFAETLLPLIHDDKEQSLNLANSELAKFDHIYDDYWINGMGSKLGIFNIESDDINIINKLLILMHKYGADYTNTFKALTMGQFTNIELFISTEFDKWHDKWRMRLSRQEQTPEESMRLMKKNNPAVIPRNHRVEDALEAAVDEGDYSVMERLLNILSDPYAYTKDQDEYSILPPPSTCPYKTFCGT
ncbi:MAG: YdiU family protein [Clostridiales bacterium]|nr:YdiU family protein [Clostridiales bacterium]